MSSLWTPDGERPVGHGEREGLAAAGERGTAPPPDPFADDADVDEDEVRAQAVAQLAAMQRQLAETPASIVVANHCVGLFDLARVYLSLQPPRLEDATLAIDALAALVDGLGDRLGEDAGTMRDALASIRLAFVQVKAGTAAEPPDD